MAESNDKAPENTQEETKKNKFSKAGEKFSMFAEEIYEMAKQDADSSIGELDKKVKGIDENFEAINKRIDKMEQALNAVEDAEPIDIKTKDVEFELPWNTRSFTYKVGNAEYIAKIDDDGNWDGEQPPHVLDKKREGNKLKVRFKQPLDAGSQIKVQKSVDDTVQNNLRALNENINSLRKDLAKTKQEVQEINIQEKITELNKTRDDIVEKIEELKKTAVNAIQEKEQQITAEVQNRLQKLEQTNQELQQKIHRMDSRMAAAGKIFYNEGGKDVPKK